MKRRMFLLCLALASVTASPYSKISDDGYGQRLQKNTFGHASASSSASASAQSSATAYSGSSSGANAFSKSNAYTQGFEQQNTDQFQFLDQQTEDKSGHGVGNSEKWWMGPNSPFEGHKSGANANAHANANANANANAHASASADAHFRANPFLNGNSQAGAHAHATAHTTGQVPSHDIQLPHVSTASKNNVFLDQQSSNGFEVTCSGEGQICVPHHLCKNGRVSSNVQGLSQVRSDNQKCDVSREVCCTMSYNYDQVPAGTDGLQSINVNVNSNAGSDGFTGGLFDQKYEKPSKPINGDAINGYLPPDPSPNPNDPIPRFTNLPTTPKPRVTTQRPTAPPVPRNSEPVPVPTHVQLGCAAALVCVKEEFCGMDGMMNPSPLGLTEEQLTRRVPLSDCKNPENGEIGKCCRDPNYVDPWPTGNLPANYSGGFDDQGFPLNDPRPIPTSPIGVKRPAPSLPVKGRIPIKNVQAPVPNAIPQNINQQPSIIRPNVPNYPTYPKPFNKNNFVESPSNANPVVVQPRPAGSCGVKNSVQRPSNLKEEEVGFGEIPWEAMILYTPEKKLLCSGAFVAPNAVLTAARCFDGYQAHDIAIKAGEWKLGYELKHEEPLPFEIVKVKAIVTHPGYLPGSAAHDVAFLYLEHDVHLDRHVGPICLQEDVQQSYVRPGAKCISTGWGKHILQVHLAGAIMHSIEVDTIEENQCRQRVSNAENQIELDDSLVCVKAHQQRNNMCQVDIGGPLACERDDGTYELVGVYNQDTGCLPTNQVATFGLIDVPWVKYMLEQPAPVEVQPKPYTPSQPQQSYEQPQKPEPYAPPQQPQQPQQPYEQPQQTYEQPQQPQQLYEQPKPFSPSQPQQSYEQRQTPEPYTPEQPQQSYEQPEPYTPQQPEQSYEQPPNPEPYAPQQPEQSYEQPPNPTPYAPNPTPYAPQQPEQSYEQPQKPKPYAPAQQPEQPEYPQPQQPKPYKPAKLPFVPAQEPRPFAPAEYQYPKQSQPFNFGSNTNQPCDCQKSNLPPYDNQYLPPN
ncbi:GSCOCG00003948001-RA-CDS [Cotesia congregata]|uniref:Similar to scaf: Inactive serine protease scarface (Drosophila melanogaster) n=1 Tax=Cotesia congregata TaxID=51543 RepID=A0A8J2MBF7_COTCN|nr:GSCOCG00003948001-RA-CDS [Cotesia congregata]CAG5081618.1 Similar to scaf: Inactive serine protease scarface (Drosophila melanogaster) [Cotesia congregata]